MLVVGLPSCRSSPSTYIWPARQKGMPSTHIHQHDRTHLLSSVKRLSTYNHQHDRTQLLSSVERKSTHIHQHDRTHLLSYVERLSTYNHQHGRTHLLPSMKWLCTYIWPTRQKGTIPSRGTHPTTLMGDSYLDRYTSYHSDKRFQHLYLVLREHIPAVTPERICTYIHLGEHIQPHRWKGLHSHLILWEHTLAVISEWPPVLNWATW